MKHTSNTPTDEEIQSQFLPQPNNRASAVVQGALFSTLERFDEVSLALANNKKLSNKALSVRALVEHWYPYRPWSLDHEVALERLAAIKFSTFFLENLTGKTPDMFLPEGFTYKSEVEDYKITSKEVKVARDYTIRTDSMAPQLTVGTSVLVVKRQLEEWKSQVGKPALIFWQPQLSQEVIGRITKVTRQTVYIRPDNRKWPKLAIPQREIVSLYTFSYITGKKVV